MLTKRAGAHISFFTPSTSDIGLKCNPWSAIIITIVLFKRLLSSKSYKNFSSFKSKNLIAFPVGSWASINSNEKNLPLF